VDLLTLSSHKIYGPQGLGRFMWSGVELVPLLYGGGQRLRLRSGTQAVPAIAGFGVAANWQRKIPWETPRLIQLRERLFAQLADASLIPTGDRMSFTPPCQFLRTVRRRWWQNHCAAVELGWLLSVLVCLP